MTLKPVSRISKKSTSKVAPKKTSKAVGDKFGFNSKHPELTYNYWDITLDNAEKRQKTISRRPNARGSVDSRNATVDVYKASFMKHYFETYGKYDGKTYKTLLKPQHDPLFWYAKIGNSIPVRDLRTLERKAFTQRQKYRKDYVDRVLSDPNLVMVEQNGTFTVIEKYPMYSKSQFWIDDKPTNADTMKIEPRFRDGIIKRTKFKPSKAGTRSALSRGVRKNTTKIVGKKEVLTPNQNKQPNFRRNLFQVQLL